MGVGWGVGYNVSSSLWIKAGLEKKHLTTFFIINFLFGWLGAKVFFLLFSKADQAITYSQEINFWLGGGFVFYGGFFFAILASLIYTRLNKELKFSDFAIVVPGLAIGHAIGRLGCFFAGCCYGKLCYLPKHLNVFKFERHPVQIYEAIFLLIIYGITKRQITNNIKNIVVIATYFLSYGLLRFFNEFLRGDKIRGIYFGVSTSQWGSILLILLGILLIYREKLLKDHDS